MSEKIKMIFEKYQKMNLDINEMSQVISNHTKLIS